MKTKLTKQDLEKIQNRYATKVKEFNGYSKEELDAIAKEGKQNGKKLSSTDQAALVDTITYKIRQDMRKQMEAQPVDTEQVTEDVKAEIIEENESKES